MKPRCQGHHDGGAHTSFLCVLDESHDGRCEPYVPLTVDEHRVVLSMLAELDALRAIVESGHERCATYKGTRTEAVERARTIAAAWEAHGRDLDAEVVAGVQAGRDDLRGLAGKAST